MMYQVIIRQIFVVEYLKKTIEKQHITVGQLSRGLQTTRSVRSKYILNSTRIKNSTVLLNNGTITIKEFLIQCSYTTDGYFTRELNWTADIDIEYDIFIQT